MQAGNQGKTIYHLIKPPLPSFCFNITVASMLIPVAKLAEASCLFFFLQPLSYSRDFKAIVQLLTYGFVATKRKLIKTEILRPTESAEWSLMQWTNEISRN